MTMTVVFVFVAPPLPPLLCTATFGAMETLRNSWSAAGHRLPVAHDLADRGSSAHYSRGSVPEINEIILRSGAVVGLQVMKR